MLQSMGSQRVDTTERQLKFGNCESSNFIILFQDGFGYSGSFEIPYEFLNVFFNFCKKHHWNFQRDCTGLYITLGNISNNI